MSFAKYRNQTSSVSSIQEKIKGLQKPSYNNELDESYWTFKHVAGPDGKGEAIIRFLPPPPSENGEPENDPIVKFYTFNKYNVTTRAYYKERGRNSLGPDERDPANEYNISILNDKSLSKEERKELFFNRGTNYIAGIYVVKDPYKPENEGKVFRMLFGHQIFKIIEAKLFPEFENEPIIPIFDPEEGADFHLRVTSRRLGADTVPNYEQSKFAPPSKRWDIDEFDKIWNQQYSLQSEIAPEKFKSYEELKAQFDRVIQGSYQSSSYDEMEPKGYEKVKEEKEAAEKELKEEILENNQEEIKPKQTETSDDWFDSLN